MYQVITIVLIDEVLDLSVSKSEIDIHNANIQQQNHNLTKVLINRYENITPQVDNAVDLRSYLSCVQPTNSTSNSKYDSYKYALIKYVHTFYR